VRCNGDPKVLMGVVAEDEPLLAVVLNVVLVAGTAWADKL
jgi:hypothetical protein